MGDGKNIIQRLRDRRTRERRRVEEIFDRQTVMSLACVFPLQKGVELVLLGQPRKSAVLFVLFAVSFVLAVWWKRVSDAAADVAESAKDAVDGE